MIPAAPRGALGAALRAGALAIAVLVCSAHVGSPDVWFEGAAGPYPVLVVVRLPGVVPGVAEVSVRVPGADRVTLFVNRYDATAAAPPPEDAVRDRADAVTFTGKLWIMVGGSNSVTVGVYGAHGKGTAVVPVVAVATRRLALDTWLEVVLAAIGVFLFVGAISIAGAAVREGPLAPGDAPDTRRRRRARFAMVATGVLATALIAGGWRWWSADDEAFRQRIYRPMDSRASVAGPGTLAFSITDTAWVRRGDTAWLNTQRRANRWSPLIPDHGKLVHLFLVGPAFAHLHPSTVDTNTFRATLPPLPAGHYRVFADLVHESGFDQTLVTTIDLPASPPPATPSDTDDAWSAAAPVARTVTLADGSTMRWIDTGTVRAGAPAGLRFVTAGVQPYMGMAGHAVVVRDDGSVFIHLHPMGTISSASQMALTVRQSGDSTNGAVARRIASMPAMAPMRLGDTVSFPYAFPKPGRYNLWVQVKRGGRILTAPFAVRVEP